MEKKSLVFGSFVADLMARAPHLPVPGETVKGSGFQMGSGGKGFNQAVAAFRAGADVTLAIKLGNDAFGDIAQNMMKELGMCRDYVFQSREHSTGCALIMVGEDSSQNEIVVVPGTSLSFTDAEVHLLEPVIQACEYLLMQLEINMDAMVMAAEYAARHGKKVILNPAPAADLPARLWQMLDIVIPNEVEAEYYTGIPVRSEKDAKKAADWFHSRGVRHVIITLAERGAYLSGGGIPLLCTGILRRCCRYDWGGRCLLRRIAGSPIGREGAAGGGPLCQCGCGTVGTEGWHCVVYAVVGGDWRDHQ